MDREVLDIEDGTLRLVASRTASHVSVRLVGELDLSCVALLDRLEDLDLAGVTEITADLDQLDFIDSTGIHALLRLRTAHAKADRIVSFVRPRPFVRRIFLVLGLGGYLTD